MTQVERTQQQKVTESLAQNDRIKVIGQFAEGPVFGSRGRTEVMRKVILAVPVQDVSEVGLFEITNDLLADVDGVNRGLIDTSRQFSEVTTFDRTGENKFSVTAVHIFPSAEDAQRALDKRSQQA